MDFPVGDMTPEDMAEQVDDEEAAQAWQDLMLPDEGDHAEALSSEDVDRIADSVVEALDWNPELHPRDGEGKFTERGGIGSVIDSALEEGHSAVEDLVSNETGVDDVSLPVLDEGEDRKALAENLVRAGQEGLTENVDSIEVGGGEAHGAFRYNDNSLRFNRNLDSDDFDASEGEAVSDSMEWLVLHELGHAEHGRVEDVLNEDSFFDQNMAVSRDGEFVGRERVDLVDEEVSAYARSNPGEFVAEVFSGKALGREFPDEVMEIYDEWGGPDTWEDYQ
jgi:hypothetical protein